MLETLYAPIKAQIEKEGYLITEPKQMEQDLQSLISTFIDQSGTALGPASTSSLIDFLDQNLSSVILAALQKQSKVDAKRRDGESQEI